MTSFADRFAQIAVSPNESNRGRKPGRPGRTTAPCHGRPYGSFSLFTLHSLLFTSLLLPILEDFAGGVVAGCAHDTAARMSTRSAQIQSVDRSAVPGPAGYRSHKEQLVQCHVTMKDVAAGERVVAFHIQRRDHLAMNDGILDIGGILRQCVDTPVGELLLHSVPICVAQSIGSILSEYTHYVFARWSN